MKKVLQLSLILALCSNFGLAQVVLRGSASLGGNLKVGGTSDFAAGMVEAWPMNEGSGSALHTVSGSGDTLTASNITWGTEPGFPGSVPIFNGTNSIAVGANQTNTNFNGSTPFTVCAWFYITGYTSGESGGTFIGTLNPSGYTGWELSLNIGPSKLGTFLINTYPSNTIQVGETSIGQQPPLNHLYQYCIAYDGSQTAAGVHQYENGAPFSPAQYVFYDTLTSSIANSNPVYVGARSDGSNVFIGGIGYITIWDVEKNATQIATYHGFGPAVP